MNKRDQSGDFPEKPSSGTTHQKRYIRSRMSDAQTGEDSTIEVGNQPLPADQASFAYQLLLLQQRLVAYEQLHLEEIAELRQEIEQLRRTFLQETSPQLRAISPIRNTHESD
ncbi:MAG: hypothetical protein ACRDIV_26935 [Ktedonobacteraceae bacterium]